MQNDDLILRADIDGVTVLTLNAPKSINALSEAMLRALSDTFDEIAEDRSVKAVILRTGGNHFCAGHNLKEMSARRADADGGFQYFQDLFATCSAMMLRVVRLPQPVIAEVKGIATAAGCQLVASCDLAVAADNATFATSGVNIGLFCSTPMVALSRNVPRKLAMEMLLLGNSCPQPASPKWGWSTAWCPWRNWKRHPQKWLGSLPTNRRPPSRSASVPITNSSKCRWKRPTPLPVARWWKT